MDNANNSLPLLPPTAAEVAQVIGREKTLLLAKSIRHRSLYVPKTLPESHWLRDIIGDEAAARLVAEFQGMQVPLAKCTRLAGAARNAKIYEMRARGASVPDISKYYGICESTIWTILYRQRGKRASPRRPSRSKHMAQDQTMPHSATPIAQ